MKQQVEKLGKIAKFINGHAYKSADWSNVGIPIIRIQNLKDQNKSFNYWSGALEGQVRVKHGDVLLAWSGTPGTSFGAHIWEGEEGVLNQHIFLVNLDQKKIEKRWAVRAINNQLNHLISQAHGGVGLKHVTKPQIEALDILLPPLDEQRRLIPILDKATDLRCKRAKTLKLLDQFLHSVFLDMFGDPVRNEKGWNTKSLGDLIDSNRGISDGIVQRGENVNEGVPVIRISNFADNKFDDSSLVYTSSEISNSYRRTVLKGGELIISIRGTVGRVAVVPDSAKGSNVSREVAVIPLLNNVSRILVYHTLLSSGVQQLILGNVKGVAQSGINLSDLRRVAIPMPTTKIISQFEQIVQAIDHLEQKFIHARAEDESLFGSVSQCAFRGEL